MTRRCFPISLNRRERKLIPAVSHALQVSRLTEALAAAKRAAAEEAKRLEADLKAAQAELASAPEQFITGIGRSDSSQV